MSLPQHITKLEAVNYMLASVGMAPLSTLVPPIPLSGAEAENKLDMMTRSIQLKGYHFNTEYDVTLTRAADNTITLGQDIIRVDTSLCGLDVTLRGTALFNKETNTAVFTADLTDITLVRYLPFESMPEPFRYWVMMEALIKFQADKSTDQVRYTLSSVEVAEAKAVAKQYDLETADHNILSDQSSQGILNRRRNRR